MTRFISITIIACILGFSSVAGAQTEMTFTYQGELKENGGLANGSFNMDFSLWDALSGGNPIGAPDVHNGVPVVDGKFTVELDFGASAFGRSVRWLKIDVDGNQLSPRQLITRAPYAIQTRGIFVDNSGNVGIGSTNTSHSELQVAGTITADAIDFWEPGDLLARITFVDQDLEFQNRESGGDISFWTREFNDRENLTIKPDGKVGIGTSEPKQRLHNVGDYYGRGHLYLHAFEGDGSNGTAYVMARDDSGTSDVSLRLRTQDNGSVVEAVHIGSDGNVGIGTSVPEFLLHVDGTAGKPGGGPWESLSDVRLKKNIEPIVDSLDTLLQLRGVTFEYIDPDAIHELPGERIGMIAQEVEKVVPDWVAVRADGYKTVTPRGFEALTVEALRQLRAEHHAEIRSLVAKNNGQIAALQDENEALRARLETLEKQFQQLMHPEN